MTLPDACERIRTALARMNEAFGRPFFNEWAVLATDGPRFTLLAYDGPRRPTFADQVRHDLQQLQAATGHERREPGGFGFTREADGRAIDAYLVLGPSLYLLCNHTAASVGELARDPFWKKAQVHFADLAEIFRLQPVTASGASPLAT